MPDELDLRPGEPEPEDDEPEPEGPKGLGLETSPGDDVPIVVEDVVYEGGVAAWLVRAEQPADGPGPGILLCHWYSTDDPVGDRDQLLGDAHELAERGAVCLLPQGRFPWELDPSGSAGDVGEIETEVARLSRGLDLLANNPNVDPGRLAIVGHDFGAMHAAILAAREDRVRALVMMAPTPRWADWFLPFWRIEESRGNYLQNLTPLDPIEQVQRIAPRPLLMQFGDQDPFVPLMARVEFRTRATDAGHAAYKESLFEADHDLEDAAALDERIAFLRETVALAVSLTPLTGTRAGSRHTWSGLNLR